MLILSLILEATKRNEVTLYLKKFKFSPLYQTGLLQLKLITISYIYFLNAVCKTNKIIPN